MTEPAVVIVGAGPAGVRAAEVLVAAGLRPVVIDEQPAAGGQIYRRPPPELVRPAKALYGFEARKAVSLHQTFDRLAGRVDQRLDTLVWEVRDGILHLFSGGRWSQLPYAALILATGAGDRMLPFPGWTLPGVWTLGGAQIALKAQGCLIGQAPVFLGTGPLLYLVAWQYARAGARVAAVLDTAPVGAKLRALPSLLSDGPTFAKGLWFIAGLLARNIPVAQGVRDVRVEADGGIGVARIIWRDKGGGVRERACDAVGAGWGLRSETQLADLLEVPFVFHEGQRQWLPETDSDGRTSQSGVYIAGDGASIAGADAAEAAGQRAAQAVLADLGRGSGSARVGQGRAARFRSGLEQAFAWPQAMVAATADTTTLCRCEGVTVGEFRQQVRRLDARDVNRAKAFTRVGMGLCQGRLCGLAAAELLAELQGVPVRTVGRLRGQPPVRPIPIDAVPVR